MDRRPPGEKNSWRVGRVRIEVSEEAIGGGCLLHDRANVESEGNANLVKAAALVLVLCAPVDSQQMD